MRPPLIATQMNNARTHSAVQPAVSLPVWGDDSTDRLGYDGTGRTITKRYLTGGIDGTSHGYSNTTALAGFTTASDRTGNKLYERHLHAETRSHLYQPFNTDGSFAMGYDSADRLRQYQRGILSSATIPYRVNAGASVSTPIILPGTDQARTYGLDGLGNWKTSNFTLVGSGGSTTSTAEVRQHNYLNEITSVRDTTGGTPTTTGFSYDKNGNLLNDGVLIYTYDAFNRVVKIGHIFPPTAPAPGLHDVGIYLYDALGRRVMKTIVNNAFGLGGITGDIPAGSTLYYYDGQQIIEQRNFATYTAWQQVYFWGRYIDELMFFAVPTATVYRVLSDLLYRSVAIVTTANVVTEAYDTDAYGNTLCYSGPGTDGLWFTNDDVSTDNPVNTTIYTGRQYDVESQIYCYRARYYNQRLGRFVSRDPIGTRGGINLYCYASNSPIRLRDPRGLQAIPGEPGVSESYEEWEPGNFVRGAGEYFNQMKDWHDILFGEGENDDSPFCDSSMVDSQTQKDMQSLTDRTSGFDDNYNRAMAGYNENDGSSNITLGPPPPPPLNWSGNEGDGSMLTGPSSQPSTQPLSPQFYPPLPDDQPLSPQPASPDSPPAAPWKPVVILSGISPI